MSEPLYLGNQLFIFPEGAGSSATTRPDSGHTPIGKIQRIALHCEADDREILAPNPGQIRRVDVITVKSVLNFTFTMLEVSPILWNLVYGADMAASATGGVNYNPGAGKGSIKAWVRIQQYDANNEIYNTLDLWASLKVSSAVDFGDGPITAEIEGKVIDVEDNAGSFASLV